MRSAPSLDDVAGAILDGTAVDWPGVDSGSDQTESPLIEQLKTLAKLRLVSKREGRRPVGSAACVRAHRARCIRDVYPRLDTRLDREVALKLLPDTPP
jgi:hypothetical protein